MMIPNVKELATQFIEKDVFLKHGKKFLKSLKSYLKIEAEIEVDRTGVGCGPFLILNHQNFILKIYSSSFGSGERLSNCYVMIQSRSPNMKQPLDLGHVSHYSLAYYANNPQYLVDNVTKAMNEHLLWDFIYKNAIKLKWMYKPHKYLSKLEKFYYELEEKFKEIPHTDSSKAYYYLKDLKSLVQKTKQEKIEIKEIKVKDTKKYKDNEFVPYKTFSEFAKKHESKIVGKGNKYFYSEKAKGLIFGVTDTYPYKFLPMTRKDYDKYKSRLKKSDFELHKKLFDNAVQIYTPKTSLTYTGILKCLYTQT